MVFLPLGNYFFSTLCCILLNYFNNLLLQKPIGLISLLDEESNFPKATDLTFGDKLKQHLGTNPCFKGERSGAFSIHHYAGEVSFTYAQLFVGMLEKDDLFEVFKCQT